MDRDSLQIRGEDQSLGHRTGFWRRTGRTRLDAPAPGPLPDARHIVVPALEVAEAQGRPGSFGHTPHGPSTTVALLSPMRSPGPIVPRATAPARIAARNST